MSDDTATPNKSWSLSHLGQFCVSRFGKMAIDAWWIGKAMGIAKAKAGRNFQAWKVEHGFSDSMVSRYMRLYEAYKSPELLEGKRIYPALEEAGIRTRKPEAGSTEATPLGACHNPDVTTEGYPSWAIPDDDEGDEVLPIVIDDGPIMEPCPATTLREHIEAALPFAIEQLIQAIDTLLTADHSLYDGVWSSAIATSLKSQFAAL